MPPSLYRCVACGTETVPAHLGGVRLKVRPLGSSKGTVAEPRVCPSFGRVELICPNPSVFREGDETDDSAR